MNVLEPKTLILPKELIPELQKPFGKLFKLDPESEPPEKQLIQFLENNSNFFFSVGDFVSQSLINEQIYPDLIIFDNKTQRNQRFDLNFPHNYELYESSNTPGEILLESWLAIKNILNIVKLDSNRSSKSSKTNLKALKITGEEDLLVLPLILESPLNSIIVYGHPPVIDGNQGIVLMIVTDELKKKIKDLLLRFKYSE